MVGFRRIRGKGEDWNVSKMMDKEFGIKAIAFIFSVSEESIKKILMKA